MKSTFFTAVFVVTLINSSLAYLNTDEIKKKGGNTLPHITAGCSPATAATDLDINNTRALIQTGGDMWWDLRNKAMYEIPKGSGKTAMFSAALWMGGVDPSGQLKVAAQRYRGNGNDFWTGPLSTTTFEIDAATCNAYDRHFVSYRDQVSQFVGWFEAGLFDQENGTTTQQDDYPNYQIPKIILEWPAHGRNFEPYNEDFYLAPFFDRNGDGVYNPLDGDYPGYDLKGDVDCSQRILNIYGDQNLWWVFNDKGNVHTESNSAAIGMEIRAQAFAFATNDEVNNMTFYNYELVNRSSFTLTETYFSQWVDADMGNPQDDYVGCDVQRGLGYCYNGDENDEDNQGAKGYGTQPPAIGSDFFQGPYQDNDGLDNPGPQTNSEILPYNVAFGQKGVPYKGLGVGYGDGIVDNERLGMRKFLYHNNGSCNICDPDQGTQYYNYLRAFWKDGTQMVYGGNGHQSSSGANVNVKADYMFPDNTDPIGWGTNGIPQPTWNEISAGNTPFDRRYMQSAGPFTLAPGAVNNITVGVVWSQATTGGAAASVQALRRADDKTQAMFDNCFKVLNGPDAPELSFQELDRELILFVTNRSISNNLNEEYSEQDPFLVAPDSVDVNGDGKLDKKLTKAEKEQYSTYYFQGYLIYQLKNASVSPADLKNPDLARLVAQCDVKDSVIKIVNYYFDESLNANTPVLEVTGEDKGIKHSFKITDDAFASGDKRLVNHKKVYFMALAYAYNYSPYNEYNPNDPTKLQGQTKPFLASRKAATGGIRVFSAIPHKPAPEAGGTLPIAVYGDEFEIQRLEGTGNGGNSITMTKSSLEQALQAPDYRVKFPIYERGKGPVKIKVIDPLNVVGARYELYLKDTVTVPDLQDAYWILKRYISGKPTETITADRTIKLFNEQIIPEWGISVSIKQASSPRNSKESGGYGDDFLEAKMTFADSKNNWLSGIPDEEGATPTNWIRAGKSSDPDNSLYDDFIDVDNSEVYEKLLEGTWAPFKLCAYQKGVHGPGITTVTASINKLSYLSSVDIVFTSDKSKWTRCPVIEMQEDKTLSVGGVEKGFLRKSPSIDKNGNPADTLAGASTDPNSANYISATGMSWFPGYAVDLETGERLNMAFGEDSWLKAENGADMIWNPTKNIFEGPFNDVRMGGKHYIYVFRNNIIEDAVQSGIPNPADRMPSYDAGKFMHDQIKASSNINSTGIRNVFRAAMWVGLPRLQNGFSLRSMKDGIVPSDVTVSLRVSKAYETYGTGTYVNPGEQLVPNKLYFVDKGPIVYNGVTYNRGQYFYSSTATTFSANAPDNVNNVTTSINGGVPLYTFLTTDLATQYNQQEVAEDALKLINVVPNPYYSYSEYETDKIDNRIRIINLPQKCSINIYTVSGVLVRTFQKDDPTITSLDWDLRNHARIPISSGIYLIHVEVPGVGERILKWFGVMRPVDLDSF